MLKLAKLFFTLSLLIFINACANDDDVSTDPESLIGTWSAISFNADIESSTMVEEEDFLISTIALGSNFDYNVTFTESAFTTSGGYDMTTSGSFNGDIISESTDSYSNVSGSGTYTADNSSLTIGGSFFAFEFNGMNLDSQGSTQTVSYEINSNNELVITQNETMETTTSGVTSTTTIVSSSTWEKQ